MLVRRIVMHLMHLMRARLEGWLLLWIVTPNGRHVAWLLSCIDGLSMLPR